MNEEDINTLNEVVPVVEEQSLAKPFNGLDIPGLEEVSNSIIPVPYVKVVQPTSQNVDLAGKNGAEATAGSFYFTDIKSSIPTLNFALLKAKQGTQTYERDGKEVETQKIAILGITLDNQKMFILTLPITSFSNFGSLVSQLKNKQAVNSWGYEIEATTILSKNDKGKYYVVKFEVKDKLPKESIEEFSKKSEEYGVVLDRGTDED